MKKRTTFLAAAMALSLAVVPVQAQGLNSTKSAPKKVVATQSMNQEDQVSPSSTDEPEVPCYGYNWNLLLYTNQIRMANGLEPLSVTTELQNASRRRSAEISFKYGHTRPDGSDYTSVLSETGVSCTASAESITQTALDTDPADLAVAWSQTSEDSANILNGAYNLIGIDYTSSGSTDYWEKLYAQDTRTPSGISIYQNNVDDTYLVSTNQTLDDLWLTLVVHYTDGTKSYMPIIEDMCSGFDPSKFDVNQTVTVTYKGFTATFPATSVAPMPFTDVDENAWYYPYIETVYYNQLMTGMNKKQFGPNQSLARAQFATILYRFSDSPDVTYQNKFADVPDGQWYTKPVLWANAAGIVNGYTSTGLFGPGDNITREQMAVMMYRYAGYLGLDTSKRGGLSDYKDHAFVSAFAKKAMEWAVTNGIITGKDNGTRLDPQGLATRAETAAIITRFTWLLY